jgi:hypothetical protein
VASVCKTKSCTLNRIEQANKIEVTGKQVTKDNLSVLRSCLPSEIRFGPTKIPMFCVVAIGVL